MAPITRRRFSLVLSAVPPPSFQRVSGSSRPFLSSLRGLLTRTFSRWGSLVQLCHCLRSRVPCHLLSLVTRRRTLSLSMAPTPQQVRHFSVFTGVCRISRSGMIVPRCRRRTGVSPSHASPHLTSRRVRAPVCSRALRTGARCAERTQHAAYDLDGDLPRARQAIHRQRLAQVRRVPGSLVARFLSLFFSIFRKFANMHLDARVHRASTASAMQCSTCPPVLAEAAPSRHEWGQRIAPDVRAGVGRTRRRRR